MPTSSPDSKSMSDLAMMHELTAAARVQVGDLTAMWLDAKLFHLLLLLF
jgi:hypothetical protein